MITKKEVLNFLKEKISNKNIIKHMLAAEAVMGGIYDSLKEKGIDNLGGTKEEWMMVGLLHDGDYSETVPVERQGVQITEWLRGLGYEIPDNVASAMAAHNWLNTGVEPKSLMDWAIFCGDSLTGLIVAATLVLPTRKLANLTGENVLNRFKEKSFAKGTRREDILMCEEKLEISLKEFIDIALKAMKNIGDKLGL